jgi:hypothetical protein
MPVVSSRDELSLLNVSSKQRSVKKLVAEFAHNMTQPFRKRPAWMAQKPEKPCRSSRNAVESRRDSRRSSSVRQVTLFEPRRLLSRSTARSPRPVFAVRASKVRKFLGISIPTCQIDRLISMNGIRFVDVAGRINKLALKTPHPTPRCIGTQTPLTAKPGRGGRSGLEFDCSIIMARRA